MMILTCEVQITPCPLENQVWLESAHIDLLLNGGFDAQSFEFAFMALMALWATGVGFGFIIAQVRKARGSGR